MTATVGSAICAVSLRSVVRAVTRARMPKVKAPDDSEADYDRATQCLGLRIFDGLG